MENSILNKVKTVAAGNLRFDVLLTGEIRQIRCGDIMINQLLGNYFDGSAQNLFLRIKKGGGYSVYPLMGRGSGSKVSIMEKQIVYTGEIDSEGISYDVYISLLNDKWFYDIFLENCKDEKTADIIYGQDIGLGSQGHVQANEAYNSQYIDHSVFETENGYAVCSRQNQRQSTGFPFLQQGGLGRIRSFSTDGYPFFGLSYKFTNIIEELQNESLNNRVYQYEFAYTALQSEEIRLKDSARVTFYCVFASTIETAVKEPVEMSAVIEAHALLRFDKPERTEAAFQIDIDMNKTLSSLPMTEEEIDAMYPVKRHEERHEGKLLSFFRDTYEHVVIADKEMLVERANGHIILSGENDFVREDILASTNYIYGVFNSQVVVGNSSFNKLMSNCRNGLNVSKSSGQRIMVKSDGVYHLLTMPVVYEMGFNYAKWFYKLDGDVLEIVSYTMLDRAIIKLEVKSHNKKKYDFIIYNQICNAPGEYDVPVRVERSGNTLVTRHHKDTISAGEYPDMTFVMRMDRDFECHDDSYFYTQMGTMYEPVIALVVDDADVFTLSIEARIDGKPIPETGRTFEQESVEYRTWLHNGINNFELSIGSDDAGDTHKELLEKVEKCNDLALWYSHNARVHYASPHGLEQYGGAAWGARDICQGPFEYFMTVQNFEVAADILEKVFTHQYIEDGSWPQWFMFDRYYRIQQHESHGDIIVWPLKSLSNYLLSTGDISFLDIEAEYSTKDGCYFTEQKEKIFDHAKKAIGNIVGNFIPGTHLSRYGGGDWDDTLQPANPSLRETMVSGWTVALTYQAFREFAEAIAEYDVKYSMELKGLAEAIKADYSKYIMKDGVTAGFILFEDDATDNQNIKYLLHPRDNETGLRYRLLPMTRSMIAEMFTKEEVLEHYDLIREHLYHADGVRLTNTTCRYRGGVNTYFMRAETAANFGREIGLQYVHAHIRFIEAMTKIGNAEEAWYGLMKINPIRIADVVPNAERRQSNCYFSSSDGAFDNRYKAMEGFDKLRTGDVAVKAGWRIYSSGSGIYLNQLICQFLGLRRYGDDVVLDPVLPGELDGLVLRYRIDGKPVRIKYHVGNGCGVAKIIIDGKEISFTGCEQPYRNGGAVFSASLVQMDSEIEVFA